MVRTWVRSVAGWMALMCLALGLGCGSDEPVPQAPAPALTTAQAAQMRQEIEALRARTMELTQLLQQLRREHMTALDRFTTETVAISAQLNTMNVRLGGKAVPLGVKTAPQPVRKAAPAEERGKEPLGPLARLALIVICLFAIWVIARLFLGRLSEDDEEDDDFGPEAADEEAPSGEETAKGAPQVENPLEESRPVETPAEQAPEQKNEGGEPRA